MPVIISLVQTLLWDFDGTLAFRRKGMWSAALVQVIQQELPGYPVTVEQIRPYLQSGFPWQAPDRPHPELSTPDLWWARLEPVFVGALLEAGLDPPDARRLAKQVRPVYTDPQEWALFDDTLPALQRCSSLGWQHCLLTNHVPELRSILAHLGLDRFLAAIFNSAESGYEKPHPQAFLRALAELGNPQIAWMIGDSYTADIQGAASVGLPGILVRKRQEGAECFCEQLEQVYEILLNS